MFQDGLQSNLAEAISAIDGMDEEEMREFLKVLAREDGKLRVRILRQRERLDSRRVQARMERDLERAWDRHERRGFVDYDKAFSFECEVHEAFENAMEALMQPDSLVAAFEVSTAYLLALQDFVVDESGDFSGSCAGACTEKWHDIVSMAALSPDEAAVRERVFSWVCAFVGENPGSDYAETYWLQQEKAADFLAKEALVDPERADEILSGLAEELLYELGEPEFQDHGDGG